jgi:hypothetical protein
MRSLVDELAAARDFTVTPPFTLVTLSPAVTVPRPNVTKPPKTAPFDDFFCCHQAWMETMIVARLDRDPAPARGVPHLQKFLQISSCWLFDQHVLPGFDGGKS